MAEQRRPRATVLGSRLRQLRESLGLVLQDVADVFGTSRNVPSQWENGQREPSYEHLLRLGDFYGVTVDWLLGRAGAEKDSPRVKQVKSQLRDYLRLKEPTLAGSLCDYRLKLALDFLVEQDPEMFSLERVASQLLLSVEALQQMLEGKAMIPGAIISRFALLANLPEVWFYHPQPQLGDPMLEYRELVERFQAEGLSPQEVEQRVWGVRRGRRSNRNSAR
jgi:transcriptional regulator with XRE-family HTH domain